MAAASLYDRIQVEIAKYPDRRSAILAALRMAQEQHGWLSPQAFREVAEAIDLSPAQCLAVASFYDMFFLEPVGAHVVEVCTNVSCALVGAADIVAAFERELGCKLGETSPDGAVTLRPVECLGGCGWAPVVSVDHRYREHFTPDDARTVVADLRSEAPRH